MEQLDLPELKEEELRAFLLKHMNEDVGVPMSSLRCPITRFYLEQHQMQVTATGDRIRLCSGDSWSKNQRPMALWSTRFVRGLDPVADLGSKGSLNGPSQGFQMFKS
jgi:hypothetical protein